LCFIKKIFQEDYSPSPRIREHRRKRRLIDYPAAQILEWLHCQNCSDKIFKVNMEPFPLPG
jgi:hypothetical protein